MGSRSRGWGTDAWTCPCSAADGGADGGIAAEQTGWLEVTRGEQARVVAGGTSLQTVDGRW